MQGRLLSTVALPPPRTSKLHPLHLFHYIRTLYSGVTGPLVAVGMVQSINFAVYDAARRQLYQAQQQTHNGTRRHNGTVYDYLHCDSYANVAMSSMLAGAILSVFTSPMLIIKTRQQTYRNANGNRLSFRQALRELVVPGRWQWRAMFVGFGPHFLSETLGRCVYFCSYEYLKRTLAATNHNGWSASTSASLNTVSPTDQTVTVTMTQRMVCAGVSGILCWSLIFPLDVVRCRIYANAAATNGHDDTKMCQQSWRVAQTLYMQQGGLRAFYRGFTVTVLRAGPVAAAVLPIYDRTLDYLSSSSL